MERTVNKIFKQNNKALICPGGEPPGFLYKKIFYKKVFSVKNYFLKNQKKNKFVKNERDFL